MLRLKFDKVYDFVQFLTENTDFTVIGIIGPPGVGKSTIMNELYGFDGGSTGEFSLSNLNVSVESFRCLFVNLFQLK